MPAEFESFKVPGARTYHGNALPHGLRIKQTDSEPPVAQSVAALKSLSESGEIQRLLDQHGAILLRGIGNPSAQTFSELVHAAEEVRGSYPYEQIGLAGKRTPVANNVWTANEGAPTTRFYQHNEVLPHASLSES